MNGAVGATAPAAFQLQWDQAQKLLRINQCKGGTACTPDNPTHWDVFSELPPLPDPPARVLPLLIYVDGALRICEGCSNKTIYFQGQASLLVKGDIRIDSSLLPWCDSPSCVNQDTGIDHEAFPRKSLFSFLTPGNLQVGFTSNRDVMGVFYAGVRWETQKQTNVVGTVTAGSFEMGNQVPKFFHVPQLSAVLTESVFRPSGAQWALTTSNWRVCRNPSCS